MDLEFLEFCSDVEEAFGSRVNQQKILREMVKICRTETNFKKILKSDISKTKNSKSAIAQNNRYHSNHDTSDFKTKTVSLMLGAQSRREHVRNARMCMLEKRIKDQAGDNASVYTRAGLLEDADEDMYLRSKSVSTISFTDAGPSIDNFVYSTGTRPHLI